MSKIILIEDDSTNRTLLKILLTMEGHSVLFPTEQSFDELLRFICDQEPDLIISDVHLRNINGIDLLKKVRSKVLKNKMRVLMTSGMDVRDLCMQAGADGFLLKPYMPDELLSLLKMLLGE